MNVPRILLALIVSAVIGCAHTPPVAEANPLAPATPVLPEIFALHEIAPNTFVFHEAEPWASNMLLAQMPDGSLVLVNAPATESSTRELASYIHARFGTQRLTVINSHHHMDSVGGNALFLEQGAAVIASAETAALIASDTPGQVETIVRDRLVPEAFFTDFQRTRLAQPSRTFDAVSGLTLLFGAEEVRVVYPGPAHSSDNVVVYFPSRRVLFGGCMVRSGDSLGPPGPADAAQWSAAIDVLQQLNPEFVVPGHGARFDAAQLSHTLDLLRELH